MLGANEIAAVAQALGDVKERCLLTGGASVPFYCTERQDEAPRATRDVDVVLHVRTRGDHQDVEVLLRQRGFRNDTRKGAPICRWILDDQIMVDVMPLDGAVLGFTNPWYAAGWDLAIPVQVTPTCAWRMLAPPFMLAAKAVAYAARGAGDPQSSHDLEDIIRLINGRPALAREVAVAPADCQRFVAGFMVDLLRLDDLPFIIGGHLNGDPSSQARLPIVRQRMQWLADPSRLPVDANRAQ
jgi:hypothetical protein